MWLELGLVALVICLCGYLLLKRRYEYFKERSIPYLEPSLLFGNTQDIILGKAMLGSTVNRIYSSFPQDKVCGMFFGPVPAYIIRDPELVKQIVIKNYTSFLDHGFLVDTKNEPLDLNLFQVSGYRWKILRRKMSPAFTSGKLKWMFDVMDDCVRTMTEVASKEVGKEVEMRELFCRLATDVIGSCGFGVKSNSTKDPDDVFRRMGKRMINPEFTVVVKNLFKMMFPKLFSLSKMRVIPEEVRSFFINLTSQTFQHRLKTGQSRSDFVQMLLQLKEKGEIDVDPEDLDDYFDVDTDEGIKESEKFVFTDEVLTAQLLLFFGAGFETSANAMSFITYFLMKHPDMQERARQEVRRVLKEHGGFTYASLQQMTYLEAFIKETMRIHPPFLMLFRMCTKTFTLDDGTTIEKGARVYIPVLGIHRDPKYFPEPEVFRPDRFLEDSLFPGSYMPFGDGPRICIAQRFAQMEIRLTIARLLDKFELQHCPKMAAVEPLRYVKTGFFGNSEGGIWCRLRLLPAAKT